jgi:hypothetical protein
VPGADVPRPSAEAGDVTARCCERCAGSQRSLAFWTRCAPIYLHYRCVRRGRRAERCRGTVAVPVTPRVVACTVHSYVQWKTDGCDQAAVDEAFNKLHDKYAPAIEALTVEMKGECVDVMAWCGASCRVVSCRVVSCRVVSCRVVSCRVVSCRVVSCRVVSCRIVSCRDVLRRLVNGQGFTSSKRRLCRHATSLSHLRSVDSATRWLSSSSSLLLLLSLMMMMMMMMTIIRVWRMLCVCSTWRFASACRTACPQSSRSVINTAGGVC